MQQQIGRAAASKRRAEVEALTDEKNFKHQSSTKVRHASRFNDPQRIALALHFSLATR